MAEATKRRRSGEFNQEAALRIYYSKPEISVRDIAEIFGCAVNGSKVQKLKKQALDYMLKKGFDPWDNRTVNTRLSFEVWNINIAELEKNLLKYRKLFGT